MDDLKLFVVAFEYPNKQNPYNLYVWANDQEDAWGVARGYMGDGIQEIRNKGYVSFHELSPKRGVVVSNTWKNYKKQPITSFPTPENYL